MSLSRAEIDHIAGLARLRLTEEEAERYRRQLSSVLDYMAKLRELDTSQVAPTATVLPLRSVLRPDEVRLSLSTERLLANAPDAADGQFRVPPVLD
jgi:aspartyl-tRNA(Asn)/glutamyl-tRNA(Gln) amidotransferase subunit C